MTYYTSLMEFDLLEDNILVEKTFVDPEVFGILIDRYTPKLLRYIRRITNVSAEDAEDILQDIFIKAYQNLRGFDTSLSFSSWMYRIAHNTVISRHRKLQARPQSIYGDMATDILEKVASELQTDAAVLLAGDRQVLETAMNDLPLKYKEVLVLRYFEEYSYDEIADIIKKPPGTVATWINRAKKKLKDILVSTV